jgi:hypothetical protein
MINLIFRITFNRTFIANPCVIDEDIYLKPFVLYKLKQAYGSVFRIQITLKTIEASSFAMALPIPKLAPVMSAQALFSDSILF